MLTTDLGIRYLISSKEEALLRSDKKKVSGLYIITADSLGIASELANLLIYSGAYAYVLEAEHCESEEKLEHEVGIARDLFGPITGLIHLAGMKACPFPATMKQWHEESQWQCKTMFQLLQLAHKDLTTPGITFRRLISCSFMGGYYGRNLCRQPGLPLAGGIQGLLKSLEYEWDMIIAKTIDFDDTMPSKQMAFSILEEVRQGIGNTEIGYPLGKRVVFSTSRVQLKPTIKPKGLVPDKNWVIFVLGGARGITAQTIRYLSNGGNRFVLVGKSELNEKELYAKYRKLDKAELRAQLIGEARMSEEKVTPAMIESKIKKILTDREIRENIAVLRSLGSYVKYVSCDVTDQEKFGELINDVYKEYGKIDLVVHGAGIIEDHLLADKSSNSFDRVFNTKVDSAFILYQNLQWESVLGCIFFSSTAGRYGNKGQSDYAAANEVLNRMAWRIHSEWKHVLIKSLNWGPWTGAGMADGIINQQFIDRGIIPISVEEGIRQFIGELFHGDPDEVEIVLGEGTWNPDRKNKLRQLFDIKFFN